MTTTQTTGLFWIDSNGIKWVTRLTVADLRRMATAGFDLKDHEALAAAIGDPYAAADLVVELHRPQWEERNLTELEFLERITDTGERFAEVTAAVLEGLVDFFRRFGDVLRENVIQKAAKVAELDRREVREQINSPLVDEAIQAELERNRERINAELVRMRDSGETSGSSPENSASIPGR